MSNDIHDILRKLSLIENKISPAMPKIKGLNVQQKSVPQLPALFKPKDISPTLTKKPYQAHPMDGYMVGETALSGADDLRAKLKALQDIQMDPRTEKDPELKKAVIQRRAALDKEAKAKGLSETMQEVDEDMLSKVKKDLTTYLDQLEQKVRIDRDLKAKAKDEVSDSNPAKPGTQQEEEIEEDPTPSEVGDSMPGTPAPVQDPTLAESPVKTFTLEDGSFLECYGDEGRGFEIRRQGRAMPTRFPNLDHAQMAVDLYRARRNKQAEDQDYIEEK